MIRKSMLLGAIALSASSASLLVAVEPVAARPIVVGEPDSDGYVRAVVHADELNLAVPAGRDELGHRISAAAHLVCQELATLPDRFAFPNCVRRALAGAQPQASALIAAASTPRPTSELAENRATKR